MLIQIAMLNGVEKTGPPKSPTLIFHPKYIPPSSSCQINFLKKFLRFPALSLDSNFVFLSAFFLSWLKNDIINPFFLRISPFWLNHNYVVFHVLKKIEGRLYYARSVLFRFDFLH